MALVIRIIAKTAAEASAFYCAKREASSQGSSTFPDGDWQGHPISFNGRVWEKGKDFPHAKAIYNPGGRTPEIWKNSTMEGISMTYPDHIDATEARIIDKIIASALAAGVLIDVRDAYGDNDEPVEPMTDPDLIRAEVAATGETLFDFHDAKTGHCFGWVMLVHGNELDVISDMTTDVRTSLILQPAVDFCEGGAA